jgi:hypothetical protein
MERKDVAESSSASVPPREPTATTMICVQLQNPLHAHSENSDFDTRSCAECTKTAELPVDVEQFRNDDSDMLTVCCKLLAPTSPLAYRDPLIALTCSRSNRQPETVTYDILMACTIPSLLSSPVKLDPTSLSSVSAASTCPQLNVLVAVQFEKLEWDTSSSNAVVTDTAALSSDDIQSLKSV